MGPQRVLLLSAVFRPDGVSTAQLLGELADDIADAGHEVRVVSTSPHFNADTAQQMEQPIRWHRGGLLGTSTTGAVSVDHLRMPTKSPRRLGRIIQWVWMSVACTVTAMARARRCDLVIVVSPPPTLALGASLVARLRSARLIYLVWELYPDALVALDALSPGSRAAMVIDRVERMNYSSADVVMPLTEAMARRIRERAGDQADQVHTLPTFADTSFLQPMPPQTRFRRELADPDAFTLVYAGNLGPAEDLEPVLQAMTELEQAQLLVFGDGSDRRRLETLAAQLALDNVHFMGHRPYSDVPEIIATADLALVVLSEQLIDDAMPSKTYRTMSCGRPILAVAHERSELARFVTESGVGLHAEPGASAIAAAVLHAIENPATTAALGRKGRELAVERYSRTAVADRFLSLAGLAPSS